MRYNSCRQRLSTVNGTEAKHMANLQVPNLKKSWGDVNFSLKKFSRQYSLFISCKLTEKQYAFIRFLTWNTCHQQKPSKRNRKVRLGFLKFWIILPGEIWNFFCQIFILAPCEIAIVIIPKCHYSFWTSFLLRITRKLLHFECFINQKVLKHFFPTTFVRIACGLHGNRTTHESPPELGFDKKPDNEKADNSGSCNATEVNHSTNYNTRATIFG